MKVSRLEWAFQKFLQFYDEDGNLVGKPFTLGYHKLAYKATLRT